MTIIDDMQKCCDYKREDGRSYISCKLGLWSVEGQDGIVILNEAIHYFEQYRSDGEYDELLKLSQSEEDQ